MYYACKCFIINERMKSEYRCFLSSNHERYRYKSSKHLWQDQSRRECPPSCPCRGGKAKLWVLGCCDTWREVLHMLPYAWLFKVRKKWQTSSFVYICKLALKFHLDNLLPYKTIMVMSLLETVMSTPQQSFGSWKNCHIGTSSNKLKK